ncbi:MAG: hypothetical protein LBM92_02180, partial [Opitutaceae bacterium]|nr:hypothetical protein [Opitutaceae bacterium]
AQNISLYFDTTTNPLGQSLVSKGAGGGGDVGGVRNLYKAGPGQTTLDAALTFKLSGAVILDGGVLQLTGNDQIVQYSGGTEPAVNLDGGALGVEGTAQTFGNLNLLSGGGSLLLGSDGQLTFAGAGTLADWITTAQLSIQNTSGIWNDDGSGAFVRFAADPSLPTLDNISFTGYEAGVQVSNTNSYYYLLPSLTALPTVEWTGAGANSLWGADANWLTNLAPDGIDVSVSIKDIDAGIATKTIDVNGAYTLARLNVSSAQPAVTLGGSGTLIFDRNLVDARIAHGGGSVLTIGNRVELKTDIALEATVPVTSGYLNWSGAVSGSGGITKTGAGTLLLNNAASTYTGGFNWRDSSVIQIGGPAVANVGDGFFGTGTLVIGDGSAKNFYLETYNEQLAGGSQSANNTTRTIASDFVLQGNLVHQRQTGLGALVENTYAGAVSSIIFTGNGVFNAPSGTATYEINNYGAGSSSGVRPPYTQTYFNGNLSGNANIKQTGYGTIYFNGDNSGLTGNYEWNSGYVYAGKDNVFGTGTVTISSASMHSNYIYANAGSGVTVSFSNPFVFAGSGHIFSGNFIFDLDSAGTGNVSVVSAGSYNMGGSGIHTFGKDNVITGAGGFRFGLNGSYSYGGQARFLGENTFSGGIITEGVIQAGRDSVVTGGTLVSGAFGTGTITFASSGKIGAYSGTDSAVEAASIRVSNPIALNSNALEVTNAGSAATLIFDTDVIRLRNGKTDLTVTVNGGTAQALSIESKLTDNGAAGGITKAGAGVLELLNTDNEITDGIDALAGVVRTKIAGASVQVGSHAPGASAFGTGLWRAQTASGSGTAGAFEVAAETDGATVTITGSNSFILNDNGQLRVTGSNVTTVL